MGFMNTSTDDEALRTKADPSKRIRDHCGSSVCIKSREPIHNLMRTYPHLIKRVYRNVYQHAGPIESNQQEELIKTAPGPIASKIENSLLLVPVSRVLNNAKLNRPILKRLNDEELIRYHLTSNKTSSKRALTM